MNTITVSVRPAATIREALEEVDAVVETLKDRADKVAEMLGHEVGDSHHADPGPAAIKTIGVALATEAAKQAGKGVAKKAAKQATERAAKQATKRASKRAARHAAKKGVGRRGVVIVALAAVAIGGGYVLWSRRRRVVELEAVDETAPDAFGAVVERVELAGAIPPQT